MTPLLVLVTAADSVTAAAKLDSATVVNAVHAAAGSLASQLITTLLPGLRGDVAAFIAGIVAVAVGAGAAFGWSHVVAAVHGKAEADLQAKLAMLPWPLINSVGAWAIAYFTGHNPALALLAGVLHLPPLGKSLTASTPAGLSANKAGMALLLAGGLMLGLSPSSARAATTDSTSSYVEQVKAHSTLQFRLGLRTPDVSPFKGDAEPYARLVPGWAFNDHFNAQLAFDWRLRDAFARRLNAVGYDLSVGFRVW